MAVAVATRKWTLEELHSLPEDGNKYELIDGELFVTPAPAYKHELIAARIAERLVPYVQAHGLGHVWRPRAVVQRRGSQVEPDIQVAKVHPRPRAGWAKAPLPVLVVEIASPYTGRRDREQKRRFYTRLGIPEYWIVDVDKRAFVIVRPGRKDVVVTDQFTWKPQGAAATLLLDVGPIFEGVTD